jgi:hypothetical protein
VVVQRYFRATKDPDATLDYAIDWSDWLANGDTIATSTWILPDGLTEETSALASPITTIWVSGGEEPQSYTLVNRITTSTGLQDDRTIILRIRSR